MAAIFSHRFRKHARRHFISTAAISTIYMRQILRQSTTRSSSVQRQLRGITPRIARIGRLRCHAEDDPDGGDSKEVLGSLRRLLSTWARDLHGEAAAFTKDITKSAVHVCNVLTPRQAVSHHNPCHDMSADKTHQLQVPY